MGGGGLGGRCGGDTLVVTLRHGVDNGQDEVGHHHHDDLLKDPR